MAQLNEDIRCGHDWELDTATYLETIARSIRDGKVYGCAVMIQWKNHPENISPNLAFEFFTQKDDKSMKDFSMGVRVMGRAIDDWKDNPKKETSNVINWEW